MQRWRPLELVLAILAASATTPALAQPADAAAARGAMGILIRNPETEQGQPPYALTDQFGRVQRLVEPSPGVSLDRYVGQRVRIKHDTGATLLASQLELPSVSSRAEPRVELREVSPAQFVPPSRATRLEEPRRFAVIPTQATEDGAEAIDLDAVIAAEQGDTLPEPVRGDTLAPIAPDEYYPEGESSEMIDMGVPHSGHRHFDCPECQARQARGYPMPMQGVDAGCPSCNPASRRGLYARADYLLWWFDGMNAPPLATTNDQGAPAILGNTGTRVVYQGELLDDARNGAQFTIGAWLDDRRDLAIEGDYLFFGDESDAFVYSDPLAAGILGRPFYDPIAAAQAVDTIAFTSIVAGSLSIVSESQFQSFGLRARTGVGCHELGGGGQGCPCPTCTTRRGGALAGLREPAPAISRIDFIAGYRFLELDERLAFAATSRVSDPDMTNLVNERFDTDNEFHGVDLGYIYDLQSRRWAMELTGKVAVGGTRQRIIVDGTTSDGTTTTTGGLLTPAGQVGYYSRDRFSVVPELSARLSYRLTDQLSVSAAYTLLYWANVVRPGDVIAPSSPSFDWQETSLWAHGLNFGLDYNY